MELVRIFLDANEACVHVLGPAYDEFGYNEHVTDFFVSKSLTAMLEQVMLHEHPLTMNSFFCIVLFRFVLVVVMLSPTSMNLICIADQMATSNSSPRVIIIK